MKAKLFAAVLVALSLVTETVLARDPEPIVNHANLPVITGSGNVPTAEQVKQAITVAGASKNWTMATQADGSLLATLVVRNKHTVSSGIVYSPQSYSISYVNSSNMKFTQQDGQMKIHPFYNRWVNILIQEINAELRRI